MEQEIFIDEPAESLKVDAALLKSYNNCPEACRLAVGDWLIIPRPKK